MPKGKGGGPRKKKGGFGGNRELLIREDGEEYAQVMKILGGGRMEVNCMDDVKRIAKVRGKFRKRVWARMNDIVLVVLREFEADKCDITHVYYADEAKQLKQLGEIPSKIEISENATPQNQQIDIKFDDEKEEKVKEKPKAEKQNLDNFMPNSDSESDEEEESGDEKKTKGGAKRNDDESDDDEESEDEEKDSDEEEEQFDPLADI